MSTANAGDTVRVHYAGRLDDGTVFDSSEGRDPLEFTLGAGQVIPGFEKAVEGMSVGDKSTKRIPAEEAYGPRSDELVLRVERDQFPDGVTPEVGQRFQMRTDDGNTVRVTVTETKEESVEIDANHPLAGRALTFDVELVKIA
ncbi:MAG TPA: peptidylprolyl isomerase [Longimicrobiales bacterium]|nr:peptidylprolyl isomerase [Longimicrobiales bacterium]